MSSFIAEVIKGRQCPFYSDDKHIYSYDTEPQGNRNQSGL